FALVADSSAIAWLETAGFSGWIALPPDRSGLPAVLTAADDAAAVVLDVRQPVGVQMVRALKSPERRVVLVDNLGPGVEEADLVVAPFGAARGERWLAGPRWVPLRGLLPAPRPERAEATRPTVLVSMGASDPGGLTVPVLEALARVGSARVMARVVANPQ